MQATAETNSSQTDISDTDDVVPFVEPSGLTSRQLMWKTTATSDGSQPIVRPRRSSSIVETLNKWGRGIANQYRRLVRHSASGHSLVGEIYYSVFEGLDGVDHMAFSPQELVEYGGRLGTSADQFSEVVDCIIDAIQAGVLPKMISAGSSGSYFMYNRQGRILGVFKPKDEEPYGPLTPKWTKWLHRNLFPCFFGRSCLIPNNGYVSEAAASVLDRMLQTNIVPYTDVAYFASPTFYSTLWSRIQRKPITPKIGSLQLFLHGYVGADKFLASHPFPGTRPTPNPHRPYSDQDPNALHPFQWTPELTEEFRLELDKLVILDYIMRNTDRGLDNWMIKVEWDPEAAEHHIKIGAIDSGLAFPWKHPDEWRSFPFGWLYLPLSVIGQPFAQKTRDHFLAILTSKQWWQETALQMRQVFEQDAEFKERMWLKQWALIKGQAFNVVQSLKDLDHGPLELARRTRIMVWDDEIEVPTRVRNVALGISGLGRSSFSGNGSPAMDSISEIPHVEPTEDQSDTEDDGDVNSMVAVKSLRSGRTLQRSPLRQTKSPSPHTKSPSPHTKSPSPGRLPQGAISPPPSRSPQLRNPVGFSPTKHSRTQSFRRLSSFPKLDAPRSPSLSSVLSFTPNRGYDIEPDMDVETYQGGTRRVIVERIQTVKTRPPVFTWF